MQASACTSPGKAEGGTGKPPPKKRNGGGRGKRRENSPQPANRPPTPPEAAKPPPPEGTEDRTPKEAEGDHPAKTGNTKRGTAAHQEKGHRNKKKKKKKRASSPAPKKGDGGAGTTRPGTGTPREKKKAQKTHPDNPAKKGWAQPRPGPSTHARTARRNLKTAGGKRGAHATTHVP